MICWSVTAFTATHPDDGILTADAATSPYLHPGVYVDLPVSAQQRHVALIAESGTCQAYVIGRS